VSFIAHTAVMRDDILENMAQYYSLFLREGFPLFQCFMRLSSLSFLNKGFLVSELVSFTDSSVLFVATQRKYLNQRMSVSVPLFLGWHEVDKHRVLKLEPLQR
jgi:hypothetical protein